MKYVFISNLIGVGGVADYKGIDLNGIIPNTQLYPNVDGEMVAYLGLDSNLTIPTHDDVQEITSTEYQAAREDYESSLPQSPEQAIEELKSQNAAMMLALVTNDLI
jgi:hypothetical protein